MVHLPLLISETAPGGKIQWIQYAFLPPSYSFCMMELAILLTAISNEERITGTSLPNQGHEINVLYKIEQTLQCHVF